MEVLNVFELRLIRYAQEYHNRVYQGLTTITEFNMRDSSRYSEEDLVGLGFRKQTVTLNETEEEYTLYTMVTKHNKKVAGIICK